MVLIFENNKSTKDVFTGGSIIEPYHSSNKSKQKSTKPTPKQEPSKLDMIFKGKGFAIIKK